MPERRGKRGQGFLSWLVLAALLASLSPSLAVEPSRNLEAEVAEVKGPATLTRGAAKSPVKKGDPLQPGDVLVTGNGGLVILTYENGHVLKLQQLSSVKLTEASFNNGIQTTKVNLDKGSLYLDLEKLAKPQDSFQVNTNNTQAGVRGTSFEVDEAEDTEVAVLEGEVEVGEGDQLEKVGAGFFNRFHRGKRVFAKRRLDNRRLSTLRGHRDYLRKLRRIYKPRWIKRQLKKMQNQSQFKPTPKNNRRDRRGGRLR